MSDPEQDAEYLAKQDEAVSEVLGPVLEKMEEEERKEANDNLVAKPSPIFLLYGRPSKSSAKTNKVSGSLIPPLARHWAVRVGGLVWEMFTDPSKNTTLGTSQWEKAKGRFQCTFKVGRTTWSTSDISNQALEIINNVKKYNVITDNCQTFAIALLNAIKQGEKWYIRLAQLSLQLNTLEGTISSFGRFGPHVQLQSGVLYALVDGALEKFKERGARVQLAGTVPVSSSKFTQEHTRR